MERSRKDLITGESRRVGERRARFFDFKVERTVQTMVCCRSPFLGGFGFYPNVHLRLVSREEREREETVATTLSRNDRWYSRFGSSIR